MSTHIVVNNLGLTYKGTVGASAATLPDVCKTPSPGGPVPIPYPNFARQSSLSDGTTTVFAKGKMIAIKGSHYRTSNGDEAGTAGGVKSGVNMKATDWITYSFDVKMDGRNACRHTDKKFHNNKNTVDLMGNVDPAIPPADARALLQKACCECDQEVKPGPYDSCATLGEKKHACCEQKLTFQQGVGGERGYNRRDGSPFTDGPRARMAGESYQQFRERVHGTCWPDACALDTKGNPYKFYDFKFGCEKDVPVWVSRETGAKGPLATGNSRPDISPKQGRKYRALAKKLGMEDTEPEAISNKDC